MKKVILFILLSICLYAQPTSTVVPRSELADTTTALKLLIADKLDISDTTNLDKYTQAEIDSIIALYYPRTEVDSLLNLHYTITQVDSILNLHYTSSEVDSIFGLYYTKTQIDSIKLVLDTRIDSTNTNVTALEDTVYSWGNHASIGYLTSESDPLYAGDSTLLKLRISRIENDTTNYQTAYGWGDHGTAGYYLASDTTKLDKYTQSEINTLLGTKSDTTHLHDDRYYTETETNNLLGAKSDTSHLHAQYLEAESDPIWASDSSDYLSKYDATQLYTNFTNSDETDQVWVSDSSSYLSKYDASQTYLTTETDPIWVSDSSTYLSKYDASGTYLTAESDPVYASDSSNFIEWKDTVSIIATKNDGYLTSESDAVWISDSTDYLMKAQFADSLANSTITESQISDLQGYLTTESDPIWASDSSTYLSKYDATQIYIDTEADQVWVSDSSSYLSKYDASQTYLDAESDPIWVSDSSTYLSKYDAGQTYFESADTSSLDKYTQTEVNNLLASKLVSNPLTWTVSGELKVPSVDTDFINYPLLWIPSGDTLLIQNTAYRINSGTSASIRIGYSIDSLSTWTWIDTVSVTTSFGSASYTTKLSGGKYASIRIEVTAVSGTPKNLSMTVGTAFKED